MYKMENAPSADGSSRIAGTRTRSRRPNRILVAAMAIAALCGSGLSDAAILVTPSPLEFVGPVGAGQLAQSVTIRNTGPNAVTFAAADNVDWLLRDVSTSTLAVGASLVTTMQAVTNGLPAGVQTGTLTLWASGTAVATIPLRLTLTTTAPLPIGKVTGLIGTLETVTGPPTLAWNPNAEGDLAGYKVYRRTPTGAYGAPLAIVIGPGAQHTVTGLTTGQWLFTVTAYDQTGNESPKSNEVTLTIP